MERMDYEKTFLYLRKYKIIVDLLYSGKCAMSFVYIIKLWLLDNKIFFIRAKTVSLYLFSNLTENGSKQQHLS